MDMTKNRNVSSGHGNRRGSETRRCSKFSAVKCLKANRLSLSLILGVFAGIVAGVVFQSENVQLSPIQVTFIRFPGELFLQMMKLVLIPVVVSSLLTATADIDVRSSGRIGLRAILYYVFTLILASLMGVTLVLTVRPGIVTTKENDVEVESTKGGSPLYAFMDLLRNLIPDNLIEACFVTKSTTEVTVKMSEKTQLDTGNVTASNITHQFGSSINGSDSWTDKQIVVEQVPGVNMIGLVSISMATGAIISYLGTPAQPVYNFFLAVRLIIFQLVNIFMWYAPVGIAFLIAATFASLPNLGDSLHNLLIFTLTVLGGLFLHGFIVLPIIYFIIVRKNPFPFIRNVIPAMILAFGSESSGITLPVTIRCLEERNAVDSRVTRLVASIGATINMDGLCLYFSMMTIFIAQLNGITFNAGQIVTSCLLAISVSIGIGCVPGAHLVYITMVPATMQLPTHQVGMLFAVDWILARARTVINILGDCLGAGIVASLSTNELKTSTDEENVTKGKLLISHELEDYSAS